MFKVTRWGNGKMKIQETGSFARRLTVIWGHVVWGVVGGFFFVGGVSFVGFGIWALTSSLDWSRPDWTKRGVILMGPILIGATQLWAACATYKTMRKHFLNQKRQGQTPNKAKNQW
ncbi:MAG: hypothetical protein A2498_10845 [Lentisphaerae bacterium RIFOXYC12_FULL_60_16]|nr:MAG: hypothetical protein A2498_10845 [Lentisphaerae bacterium RIFOXYC12_FULL_60_16]